jgi:hypothetical protein
MVDQKNRQQIKMKKILVLYGMICWLSVAAVAQETESQKPEGGRLEALKIAYITKQLNLTPEEAQRFWPVYNQYSNEIKGARQEAFRTNEPEITTEEKLLNIRKKYNGDFVKALSPQRADQFFKVEKEFGARVAKEWMQRRQMRLQQRRPGLRQ